MLAAPRRQLNPPRPPRQRLSSINNPNAGGPPRANRPSPPAANPTPTPAPPTEEQCCSEPEPVDDDDGRKVCANCAHVIKTAGFSTDLVFAENAAGGATVVGGFIGESQRYANSMGGPMRGLNGRDSRQTTIENGTKAIEELCGELHLSERIKTQANTWYRLALNHNFVQGRRIKHVAAVAIYLTARKQPANTLLLIDLSERVLTNVWDLGRTYKQFCKTIMETDPGRLAGSQAVQEIEPLMLKFCRKLEFGEFSEPVAADACRLLTSMDRDWMVQGRNPAGLCGACILMSARMNNFRRTVREVVYVVKVADTTINHRLYEYKRTRSSLLTVDQFREFHNTVKPMDQPPAVWRREEREQRAAKRKAGSAAVSDEDGSVFDGDAGSSPIPGPSNAKKPETRASKKRKLDRGKAKAVSQDNDARSALDVDALEDGQADSNLDALASSNVDNVGDNNVVIPTKKRRGRPKKAPPRIIPREELEIERELEQEIGDNMRVLEDWQSKFKEFERNDRHPVLVQSRQRAAELALLHMPTEYVNDEEELGADEFDDDPDVVNVILSDAESKHKELVWMAANEDWLRAQQEKILAKALEEAQGKPAKPKLRRQRNRMGDGSVLGGEAAATPAESAYKMAQKRGGKAFSSHLNYEVIQGLFGGPSPSTQASTPEASATAGASKAVETVEVEDDDEDDYEEEEIEEAYDEEDLENTYAYDEDEGFGNATYDDY
ncbi:hypothetical protein CC80DRAFT_466513 [Byssothecium circinans]|uniref:BRF1-domain-containing protein n=1 Tax=Byssothecium circinans TaxID=147558 RepID=A0A6A5U4F0_9PLEO|nr:hypothetical protein CC80DRAFT_466513 [Byssothecium circinans]